MPALYVLLSLSTQAEQTGKAFGVFGMSAVAGMAAGPLVSSAAFDAAGLLAPFLVATAASILAATLLAYLSRSTLEGRLAKRSGSIVLLGRSLISIIVAFGLVDLYNNLVYGALQPTFPLYLKDTFGVSYQGVAWLFSAGLIIFAIAAPASGYFVDRLDAKHTIVLLLTLLGATAACLLIVASVHTLEAVVIVFLFFMICQVTIYVLARKGLRVSVGSERSGLAFGMFGVISDVGWLVGPVLVAPLYASFGPRGYVLTALLVLPLIALILLALAVHKKTTCQILRGQIGAV
jgi:MFS family permease